MLSRVEKCLQLLNGYPPNILSKKKLRRSISSPCPGSVLDFQLPRTGFLARNKFRLAAIHSESVRSHVGATSELAIASSGICAHSAREFHLPQAKGAFGGNRAKRG